MNTLKRSSVLAVLSLLLALALLFTACQTTAPESDDVDEPAPEEEMTEEPATEEAETEEPEQEGPITGRVRVFDWAGYDEEAFWSTFAEAYPNVDVEFSFFMEDSEALAKVESGFETDLVHPCWHQLWVDHDLMVPLDTSKLTNWDSIPDRFKEKGFIDGEQYFAPQVWGYDSILVRTDLVEETPTAFADLWDPQYEGMIGAWDSGEYPWVYAALSMGYDPYNATEEQREEIREKVIALKPNIRTFYATSAEGIQLLASGDVAMTIGAWVDMYLELKEDYPMEYVIPEEGATIWLCGYGIAKTVEDIDLAHAYIDHVLDPEPQAFLPNAWGYGMVNMDAVDLVTGEMVEALSLDEPEVFDDLFVYQDVSDELLQYMTDSWDMMKAAP